MDLVTLKSQAYDILAQMEYLQKQLAEVNAKIAEEMAKKDGEQTAA
jgi:hypothetical protein